MHVLQFVIETELDPLRFSELVKRQNINSLDVPKFRSKSCQALDIARVVGQSGKQHIAQPYGPLCFGQAPGKLQRWLEFF